MLMKSRTSFITESLLTNPQSPSGGISSHDMPRLVASTHQALALQLLQMRDHRLHRAHQELVPELRIHAGDDLLRGRVARPKGLQHLTFALLAMGDVTEEQRFWILDDGPVRREYTRGIQCEHAFERRQVGVKITLVTRWDPHCRALDCDVAAEERP